MWSIQFKHPEPKKNKNPVWPVFTPFAGCPFKCIYCSQFAQTGQTDITLKQIAPHVTEEILARHQKNCRPISIGFFGGTFTGINQKDMIFLLKQACKLKKSGAVNHIRCSTRPDFINENILNILKAYNLDMIELGIQSFDNNTLKSSGRGYSSSLAIEACLMVKEQDLELGVQLMPGLPGSELTGFDMDIRITEYIAPDIVRIYPCLVLKNTPLAALMNKGHYKPWNLQTTVSNISRGLLKLWLSNIPVIRIGLSPEPSLIKNILAGPWHPALGSICRSDALKNYFLSRLETIQEKPLVINIPERYASDFWGYKKMNARSYAEKGITREKVITWEKDSFRVYFS